MAQITIGPDNGGLPLWLEDANGLQMQLCDDNPAAGGGNLPCPGADNTGGLLAAMYYWAGTEFTGPNGDELFIIEGMILGADEGAGAFVMDSNVSIRLRPGAQPLPLGNYFVETPWGDFGPFVVDPASGEVRVAISNEVPGPFVAGGTLAGPIDLFFSSGLGGLVEPTLPTDVYLGSGVFDPVLAEVVFNEAPFVNLPANRSGIATVVMPNGSRFSNNLWGNEGHVFSIGVPATSSAMYNRDALGAGALDISVPIDAALLPAPGAVNVDATAPGVLPETAVPPLALPINVGGTFSGTELIDAADALPASLDVTVAPDLVGTTVLGGPVGVVPITDRVVVTQADFNAGSLTVVADSTDDFVPPVLTVSDNLGAPLGTIDTSVANTLVVNGLAAAPAGVDVASANGGAASLAVTDLTAPPAADGGAAPIPGGGGGGGGGCFISELFN